MKPTRLGIAGLMLVLTMASAQAQVQPGTGGMNIGRNMAAEQKGAGSDASKVKANDKSYNSALKNLPDKQYDPWHGVR